MKNSVATNFPFISDQIIRQLANGGKCKPGYVRMILRGDRESNSLRAKTILRTAKKVNTQLERLPALIQKNMQVITDAD